MMQLMLILASAWRDVQIHKGTAYALLVHENSHDLSSVLESVMCSWGEHSRSGKFVG